MVRDHRVCSGALHVQVMETPIDAPTYVEGGKPGDPGVGGGAIDQLRCGRVIFIFILEGNDDERIGK